jgi:hypothetical protein
MKRLVLVAAVAAVASLTLAGPSGAGTPTVIMNEQGMLFDSTGAPAAGSHTLHFALNTASSSGGTNTVVWSSAYTVTVDPTGYYELDLGDTATFPSSTALIPADFAGDRWLSIQVDTDPVMTPFEHLGMAPYAANALSANALSGAQACPAGYTQDTTVTTYVRCTSKLASGQTDVMVKVGDFWMDQFEMSNCSAPGTTGSVDGRDTTAVGCSVSGVLPQGGLDWFQYAQMCGNAGKRICTNSEWQMAVSGTADPGASAGTGGACVTSSSGPRVTGGGTACISRWGVEDMVGNLWEIVFDWMMAGPDVPGAVDGQTYTPWSFGDGFDTTANFTGQAYFGTSNQNGMPAMILRGGAWGDGTAAGPYEMNAAYSPEESQTNGAVGTRCCIGP